MTLAELRILRKQRGWTQSDLAKRLGIGLRRMQELERDGKEIEPTLRLALQKLLADTPEPAESHKMELDFQGLIQILAKNLYNKKDVFIRELIQNAHDACWRRHHRDPAFDIGQATIDILPDLTFDPGRIIFRDNGEGMRKGDLINFLSAIGRSGTRAARGEAPETIGQFGIGFLSGFVVARRLEVCTRHFSATPDEACLWASEGSQDYTIAPTMMDRIGTEVTITLKDASERGFVNEEAVRKGVGHYADMLKIPIYVNDPHHTSGGVNMRIMPWERQAPVAERELEYLLYLGKRVPDNVLEIIPVDLPETKGLLYITKTRVFGRDMPRTVRVFLRRMFLCDGAEELLPPWATFVNGIINTTELEPNAARDNFMRDAAAQNLQQKLGACIIEHLEALKSKDAERLAEILAYHDISIKAACHYNDEFYHKFAHLLEWRVNPGASFLGRAPSMRRLDMPWRDAAAWVTLPELLAHLPESGGSKRLYYFTSRFARSQYFQMADAASAIVLDASELFEEELLKEWAKKHDAELSLVRSDQHDDPTLFGELDSETDNAVRRLADAMSHTIHPGGRARVDVVAKRIKPPEIAAILKDEEQSRSLQKAYSLLSDVNASGETKRMAEELIRLSHNADMHMVINAENTLVRGLAQLIAGSNFQEGDRTAADARELMLGLYNSALLSNQQMMSAQNARIFHEQFQRLMQRIIDYSGDVETLRRHIRQLEQEVASLRPIAPTEARKPGHLRGFYVTPFGPDFDDVRTAMQHMLEAKFFCQVLDATNATYHGRISENVRQHICDADFFVVDITGPKPGIMNANVMIELGAIDSARPTAPCLPIACVAKKGNRFELPADIRELIYTSYAWDASPPEWQKDWEEAFRANHQFNNLIIRAPDKYLAPAVIYKWVNGAFDLESLTRLSREYATFGAWQQADIRRMEAIINDPFKKVDALKATVLEYIARARG